MGRAHVSSVARNVGLFVKGESMRATRYPPVGMPFFRIPGGLDVVRLTAMGAGQLLLWRDKTGPTVWRHHAMAECRNEKNKGRHTRSDMSSCHIELFPMIQAWLPVPTWAEAAYMPR